MNHSTTTGSTVPDPVCGMTIDLAKAAGSSSHGDTTYYFCSRTCEMKFNAAPGAYLSGGATGNAGAGPSCC